LIFVYQITYLIDVRVKFDKKKRAGFWLALQKSDACGGWEFAQPIDSDKFTSR
jgi:hypothetical protein